MNLIYLFILVFIITIGSTFFMLSITLNPFTISIIFSTVVSFLWVKDKE